MELAFAIEVSLIKMLHNGLYRYDNIIKPVKNNNNNSYCFFMVLTLNNMKVLNAPSMCLAVS